MKRQPACLADSQTAKADGIDGHHLLLDAAGDQRERRHIASNPGHCADHGDLTDASELMHANHASKCGHRFYGDVSSQVNVVCKGDAVFEGDVVAKVTVSHDVAIVANSS